MAESADKTTKKAPRIKRKLRETPTLREQAEISAAGPKPKKRSKLAKIVGLPFRFVGKFIKSIALLIAKSPIGKFAVAVWKSKLFIPIRFIIKIIAKILFIDYFVKSWYELKQVHWPDTRTTARLTYAVILFAFVFGFIIAGMDFVFEKLFREVIL